MTELRGALIGCGFFAVNQMNAWGEIEGVRMVAICDRDEARLDAMGERFGIAARYRDAAEMLRAETPDFVDIATTAPSHRALVELAASLSIPVICQKPFAPSMADARAMVSACERAGVPLMVHENFRWQSPILRVREALNAGTIGTPFFGRVSFRSAYDVYFGQPISLRASVSSSKIWASTRSTSPAFYSATSRPSRPARSASTRAFAARMSPPCCSTTRAGCTRSWTAPMPRSWRRNASPDAGGNRRLRRSIRLDAGYRLTVTDAQGTRHEDVSPPLLAWAERPWHNIQESVLLIQKHWVESLRAGREPDTSGRDNLKTLALVEAAYQGAASRQTVDPASL